MFGSRPGRQSAKMQAVRLRDRTLRWVAPLLWKAQVVRWQLGGGHLVGAKLVLTRGDEVLLVRHTYRNGWFLPGGGLKRGESLEAAARREAREEVGARIGNLELLGVYTHQWRRVTNHQAVFCSNDFELTERPHWEIAQVRFFPRSELPAGLGTGDRRRIEEHFSGVRGVFGRW